MKHNTELQQFAAFVKNERLHDFARAELKAMRDLKVPLLKLLEPLGEDKLLEITTDGLIKFLTGIETGSMAEIENGLAQWRHNQLPHSLNKTDISLNDILMGYAAQKMSFLSFLPDYLDRAQKSVDIVLELEKYYHKVQKLALGTLESIQLEDKKKLLETEERYKDLFDNATDLIHICAPNGEIWYVNKAWRETLGYSEEDIKGASIYDHVMEKDVAQLKHYRERIISGHQPAERILVSLVAKDKSIIVTEASINCKFEGDTPVFTRGILRNITGRLEYEQKLAFYTERIEEQKNNIEQIITSAPDAIIVINERSEILLWNPMAEQLFGWKANEVLDRLLPEVIIPKAYREAHLNGMRRLLTTGESTILYKTVEVTGLHKTKGEIDIAITISRMRVSSKWNFIAFLRDITIEKEHQKQLSIKQQQLEKQNEELEQYAWLASHDLKEPLRKIQTFSDLLIQRHQALLPESGQSYLSAIHNAAARMSNLIQDILSYSRVSPNNKHLEMVDLNKIVADVIQDLDPVIKESGAEITANDLGVIECDSTDMSHLFQNLISNALKYRKPEIAPAIKITGEQNNDVLYLQVKDNGIGFEPEYAEKIFQMFQRLHSQNEYEGTGIGLALCKKIVERYNGHITAEGMPGVGATFTITLPIKQIE
ncbi:PAS domain-containing sensor histidine kinase [Polluticoccus soli]|uniref:PAS domain-containing sensor histidine kinase n=1 Tax=Polluticoccus soli TaxID=3034150 RepID=UPI0023E092DC|nr:PAS domain S-box protein [Flavipsychrobacter sp. JY13-12]